MDYRKVQSTYSDSVSQFDSGIFRNSDHGKYNFSEIEEVAKEMQSVIYELELMDFRTILPNNKVTKINSFRGELFNYLTNIVNFDLGSQLGNREHFINSINSLYNNQFGEIEDILNGIKLKELLSKGDNKKLIEDKGALKKEIEEATELRKRLEEGLKNLKAANSAGEGTGTEIASQYFQASITDSTIKNWEDSRRLFWIGMISWFSFITIIYILIQGEKAIPWIGVITNSVENKIELGTVGLIGFILLYFGFSFATNNYYIEKSLNIENKHRKNIIDTYPLLTNADPNEVNKGIIRLEAVKSIFAPIGQKIEGKGTEITTPFLEIIKGLVGKIQ